MMNFGLMIDRLSRWLLAAVFVSSAVDKLFHYGGFVTALASSVLVPSVAAPYLALPVILLELAIGAGLVSRRWRRPAALGACALLTMFVATLTANALFAPPGTPCGCWFTLTLGESNRLHISLDVVLLTLAASVAYTARREAGDATLSALDPIDRGSRTT